MSTENRGTSEAVGPGAEELTADEEELSWGFGEGEAGV